MWFLLVFMMSEFLLLIFEVVLEMEFLLCRSLMGLLWRMLKWC